MIHKFEPQDIYSCYRAGLLLLSHTHKDSAELDAETESRLETHFSTFHVTTEIFTCWLQALNAVAQGKIALHDTYLVEVEPADRARHTISKGNLAWMDGFVSSAWAVERWICKNGKSINKKSARLLQLNLHSIWGF
ncbi:hypothetical protein BG000_007911 [Podila horticola]|nr:hypothetical protein BG000_007911 [Podila horticola]